MQPFLAAVYLNVLTHGDGFKRKGLLGQKKGVFLSVCLHEREEEKKIETEREIMLKEKTRMC